MEAFFITKISDVPGLPDSLAGKADTASLVAKEIGGADDQALYITSAAGEIIGTLSVDGRVFRIAGTKIINTGDDVEIVPEWGGSIEIAGEARRISDNPHVSRLTVDDSGNIGEVLFRDGSYSVAGVTIETDASGSLVRGPNNQTLLKAYSDARSSVFSGLSVRKPDDLIPVATRTEIRSASLRTDAMQATYFTAHRILLDSSSFRLIYGNRRLMAAGSITPPNEITVKVSVEHNGRLIPVTFGDATSKTLQPGEDVVSDLIPIFATSQDWIRVRTCVSVSEESEGWPLLYSNYKTALSEGGITGADHTATAIGSIPTLESIVPFGPSAVLGRPSGVYVPTVGLIGSSYTVGFGDAGNTPHYEIGYFARAFSMHSIPYVQMGVASDKLNSLLTSPKWRLDLIKRCNLTYIIQECGSNDIFYDAPSAETMKTNLIRSWELLAGYGLKVIQPTFCVRNTSTDSWATLENQTAHATDPIRQEVNTWLRSVKHPALSAIWDTAAQMEEPTDRSKWRVTGTAGGFTYDGTHLSQMANTLLAGYLSQFTSKLLEI